MKKLLLILIIFSQAYAQTGKPDGLFEIFLGTKGVVPEYNSLDFSLDAYSKVWDVELPFDPDGDNYFWITNLSSILHSSYTPEENNNGTSYWNGWHAIASPGHSSEPLY